LDTKPRSCHRIEAIVGAFTPLHDAQETH